MQQAQVTVDGQLDGVENMERDRVLLQRAELGHFGCRVYEWDGTWISLGAFQDPSRDLAADSFVPWVMRPTGGRAVLHGHDLTVAIGAPLMLLAVSDENLSRSVRKVYRMIARPLIEALRYAGVDAALGEDTPHFRSKLAPGVDCFEHISANDIANVQTGAKLCGCALRLTDRAVLAQISIPVRAPLIDRRSVFRCTSAQDSFVPIEKAALAEGMAVALASVLGIEIVG